MITDCPEPPPVLEGVVDDTAGKETNCRRYGRIERRPLDKHHEHQKMKADRAAAGDPVTNELADKYSYVHSYPLPRM